jgi:hypothetical protein
MKLARSTVVLFLPSIASVIALACSNSSGSGNGPLAGEDSGAPVDTGVLPDTSVADTGAALDAPATTEDSAISDSSQSVPEAAPAPTCGPAPARYTVFGDAGANAGLVQDNTTGLIWMSNSVGGEQTQEQTQSDAATYCAGIGMRLPTENEALGIAAANYAPCAFGQWSTWTSTAAGTGDAWVVDYLADTSPQLADNFPSAVLCVRGGAGD